MTPPRPRIILLRRALDRRLGTERSRQEGMALMSALLFMILLSGLSLVLLSVILGQIGPAYFAQKGTKTVYAAQAGLQSTLGSLRSIAMTNAVGDVVGDISKLPCSVQGNVDGADPSVKYQVTVRYYLTNPTGRSEAWLNSNKLYCVPGGGVSTQPKFAYVESRGSATSDPGLDDGTGNRGVAAVYQFKVTNKNIPGGHIYEFNRSNCIEAVPTGPGGTVRVNDRVRFTSASSCNDSNNMQKWIYDVDYKIKLAITTADGAPGLCITGPTSGNASPQDARLETCRTNSSRFNQLWSWEGSHTWWGQQNPISNGRSNWCMTKSDNSAGGYRHLDVKNGGCTTFAPDPAAGAGAASFGTKQIVNYTEFGRCLDVTGEQINSSYMIDYPCKQDPTGTGNQLNWNHKWFYQEPTEPQTRLEDQQIYVFVNNQSSQKRCLQAPTSSGGYPVFRVCNGSDTQKWDRIKDTGEYASSYLFRDYRDRCLTADPTDRHDGVWSKIKVAPCTDSELQKWNAPASYNNATFGGYKELGE